MYVYPGFSSELHPMFSILPEAVIQINQLVHNILHLYFSSKHVM